MELSFCLWTAHTPKPVCLGSFSGTLLCLTAILPAAGVSFSVTRLSHGGWIQTCSLEGVCFLEKLALQTVFMGWAGCLTREGT